MNKYLKLGKFNISVPVALTGFLGYFMVRAVIDMHALYTVSGIFLLSLSSAALNQIQERHTDALMKRTSQRPLPSGQVTLPGAIIFSSVCALAGSLLLLLTGHWLAAALGIFTLAWYNLVYTPLKRVTAFAVLPGALIGALPPLIGWTAAGGNPLDMEILAVAFLLFVGQMPHYWLLLLKVGDEFHQAGLPVITSLFDQRQIRNLSFIWIAATGVCVLMLPATPVIRHRAMSLILIAAALIFLIRMFRFSFRGNLVQHWKKAFITVNLFYLLIILVLIADRMF
ncbi:MAG: protoheme IX farnesyltransferase [Bacteroidetes bacterium]|nr:MAG: protoheme IX farnesyltransferase [Bacteroidota bacterium]